MLACHCIYTCTGSINSYYNIQQNHGMLLSKSLRPYDTYPFTSFALLYPALFYRSFFFISFLKPPKSKKQKISSDEKKTSTMQARDDIWFDIPTRLKNKLIKQIDRCFIENNKETEYPSGDKNVELAYSLQEELDDIIYPSPSTSCRILERMEMTNLLYQAETEENDGSQEDRKNGTSDTEGAVTLKQKQKIIRYVANMTRLIQKAIKVYRMIDTSNNGCINQEDLHRAIQELDSTPTTGETTGKTSYEDILNMMTYPRFNDVHGGDGNITVNCDDIVRIAKLINL